jgi:hypothetical protein
MSLNWTTIKMYLTPPLTPPFPNGGVKSFDELTDDLQALSLPDKKGLCKG